MSGVGSVAQLLCLNVRKCNAAARARALLPNALDEGFALSSWSELDGSACSS